LPPRVAAGDFDRQPAGVNSPATTRVDLPVARDDLPPAPVRWYSRPAGRPAVRRRVAGAPAGARTSSTSPATYWNGYMDGAIRAGERAAREVLARL